MNKLPTQSGLKVWTKKRDNIEINYVKDLMLDSSYGWNKDITDQMFLPFETKKSNKTNTPLMVYN